MSIFEDIETALPEQSGADMTLTLDRVIQEIAYTEIANRRKKCKSEKAARQLFFRSAHVSILALASYPTYDPNHGKPSSDEGCACGRWPTCFEPAPS